MTDTTEQTTDTYHIVWTDGTTRLAHMTDFGEGQDFDGFIIGFDNNELDGIPKYYFKKELIKSIERV